MEIFKSGFDNLFNAQSYVQGKLNNGANIIAVKFSEVGPCYAPNVYDHLPKIVFFDDNEVVDFVIADPWHINGSFWKYTWDNPFLIYLTKNTIKGTIKGGYDSYKWPEQSGHYYFEDDQLHPYDPENDTEFFELTLLDLPLVRIII